MRAMVLTGHGDIDKLQYQEVPTPRPKANEVLVEVYATAKNNTDRKARLGLYATDDAKEVTSFNVSDKASFTFPRIQGADVCGRVVEVGANVDSARIGERGLLDFNIYPNDNTDINLIPDYYGHGRDGGYAEYIAVDAGQFYAVEEEIVDDAGLAAMGMCSYQTAYHMLTAAGVKKGEKVLISGASGGVGTALIQLCRIIGAVPYALSRASKARMLEKLGAQSVIDRSDFSTLKERILEATGGENIDAVMDMLGGEYTNIFIDTMIHDMYARDTYPRISIPGASAGNAVKLLWTKIYLYQVQIFGVSHGTKNEARQLIEWIREKKLRPLVHKAFTLSQLHEAERYFEHRGNNYIGKIVVVPDRHWKRVGQPYA
jgi:NADPH:quinone reductase-like Zn-dependent oxidoreductase